MVPRVASVKVADIMEAAGVSKSYATTIRSGRYAKRSRWPKVHDIVKS